MAKFKATRNFYMSVSDRQFDAGKTYDLTIAEAAEINKINKDTHGQEWLERVNKDKAGETAE